MAVHFRGAGDEDEKLPLGALAPARGRGESFGCRGHAQPGRAKLIEEIADEYDLLATRAEDRLKIVSA